MAGEQVDFLTDLAAQGPTPSAGTFLGDLAATQAPQKTTPQAQPSGLGYSLWSAAARPIAKAVSALPLMAMDAGVASRNLLTGSNYELPSSMFNQMLNQYTEQPTGWGKPAELVSTGLLGAAIANPSESGFAKAPENFVAPQQRLLTGAQQQALGAGTDLGMRTTPGQRLGSVPLQQLESKLESQPWSSGPFESLKSETQQALNGVAARSIGEESPTLDASVLGRASDRIGNVFESVKDPSRIVYTQPGQTKATIDAIDNEFSGLLPSDAGIRSQSLVARLETLADSGSINAEQLGQLSSKLGKSAYKQMSSASGDRDLGQALYRVKDYADDLLQSSLTPEESAAFGAARGQYRNLMLLSRPGVVNASNGNVSGTTLANVLQRVDKPGFLFGGNTSDLYNAARFAQAFKPVVGNSGTATRSLSLMDVADPLSWPIGLTMNLGSRAYLSRPGAAVARGLMATPSALYPAVQPALVGGLLARQTQ